MGPMAQEAYAKSQVKIKNTSITCTNTQVADAAASSIDCGLNINTSGKVKIKNTSITCTNTQVGEATASSIQCNLNINTAP
jgi:uncharacterized Zn-finger protein